MGKSIPLHKKPKPVYKYGINEQIAMLPRTTTINDLLAHLRLSNIARAEFYSDRNILAGSEKSIPSDRLLIYTKVFDCSIEDLVLEDVEATSIRKQRAAGLKSVIR